MNYEVLEGKGPQFEAVFRGVLDVMNEMEGHVKSSLYSDVLKANAYLIVSEWSDEGAFRAFTQSDKFKKVTDWGKEQILACRPTHEVYGAADALPKSSPGCPVAHNQAV